VTLKGLRCDPGSAACLPLFAQFSAQCCAPGIHCEHLGVPGTWLSWTFSDPHSYRQSIFGAVTRAAYLAIYQRHCHTLTLTFNLTCLFSAYLEVEATPWEALDAGIAYTSQPYMVAGSQGYLSFTPSLQTLAPAQAAATPVRVYLQVAGEADPWQRGQQRFYLLAYPNNNPYCLLASDSVQPAVLRDKRQYVYWLSLQDAPGVFLNIADYCGALSVQDTAIRQLAGDYLSLEGSSGVVWSATPVAITLSGVGG
jgi:hypothetical protein